MLLQVTTEDLGRGLVGELVDEGQLLLLDECDQGIGSLTLEVDTSLVELEKLSYYSISLLSAKVVRSSIFKSSASNYPIVLKNEHQPQDYMDRE